MTVERLSVRLRNAPFAVVGQDHGAVAGSIGRSHEHR